MMHNDTHNIFLWALLYLSAGKRNIPFCVDLQKAILNQKKKKWNIFNISLWQFPTITLKSCGQDLGPVTYLSPCVSSIRRNKHTDVIVW